MQYLDADNWDEVLALFEEGGKFAGGWGWLEVLREAELGDTVEAWFDYQPVLTGSFIEQDGELTFTFSHNGIAVHWLANETIGLMASGGNERVSYWVRNATQNVFVRNYKHIHVIDRGVDWIGAGLDATGIAADLISPGAGGRVVNAIQVGKAASAAGQVA